MVSVFVEWWTSPVQVYIVLICYWFLIIGSSVGLKLLKIWLLLKQGNVIRKLTFSSSLWIDIPKESCLGSKWCKRILQKPIFNGLITSPLTYLLYGYVLAHNDLLNKMKLRESCYCCRIHRVPTYPWYFPPFRTSQWFSFSKPDLSYSGLRDPSTHIFLTDWPLANDDPGRPTSCKWLIGSSGRLQLIFWNNPPLSNDHLDGSAFCKWSSGRSSLLQMIITMNRPFTNYHPDGESLALDHPDQPAS